MSEVLGLSAALGMSSALLDLIFAVAAGALTLLNILLLLTVFTNILKLWPTPSPRSWQHYTFWPLFRGGLGLTLLYAALTFPWPGGEDLPRVLLAFLMMGVGFGFLIYGYFDLGIGNTYGSDDGLVTKGLYRYSRNPQYVASIIGFSGVALAHAGGVVLILCGLALLVYLLLPFAEEPWLAEAYGSEYESYRERTPRFLVF